MKNVIKKSWRDSASLIVLNKRVGEAARASTGLCNYDILLQTRTERASFKNSVVFPGGVYEAADTSPDWLQLLRSFGYTDADFTSFHRPGAPLTPILQNDPVQRHIALRITAIRETFEEVGLLICSRTKKENKNKLWADVVSDIDIKHWQDRVSKNPSDLLTLCKEVECYPDIWSLYYWSNWLTPSWIKKRFNTAFFVTALKETPTIEENSEVAKVEWSSPTEILKRSEQPNVILYPPQVYELNRLAHFSDIEQLARFARKRSSSGTILYYHVTVNAKDGKLYVFPGDDLYPSSIDLENHTTIESDKTLAELQQSSKSIHRFEFTNSETFINFKNYKPDHVVMDDKPIKVHVTLSS